MRVFLLMFVAYGRMGFVFVLYFKSTCCHFVVEGSYKCRAGWAYDAEPRLIFKNLVAKQRGKKEEVQVGNDITNIDVVKFQLKSQFERNVVTQYDIQVTVNYSTISPTYCHNVKKIEYLQYGAYKK